jgi:hypothetical protein
MTAPATPHYNPTPTADQLLDSPLPDQTLYVLDRMLQCNNPRPSMLAGLPRGGKSTLATQIAVAVANGTDTLERPTTRGHVIFWKTEDYEPQTHAQFRKAGLIPGVSDLSFIFPKRLPQGTDKIQVLLAELEKYPNTKLVVIETLSSYMDDTALNESKDIIAAFDKFYADIMAHYPKPAYLLLHQFNKNSKGNDRAPARAMMRINGSIFLSAATACTIYLDQVSDEDKRRTIMTEGREGDVEIPLTYLHFDAATNTSTLGITVADERAAKAKDKKDQDVINVTSKITDLIQKNPRITKTNLVELLRKDGVKGREGYLLDEIQSLVDLGWVSSVKEGRSNHLTWIGVTGDPAPKDAEMPTDTPVTVAVSVADAMPAGTIIEDPSWGTSFKVSSYICHALTLSSDRYKQRWDVIAQNLLTKGQTSEYIIAIFDHFRDEKPKNDEMLRDTPEIFEKQFDAIATRMTERMAKA